MLFATTWIDVEGILLSAIRQRTQRAYDLTSMWSLEEKKNTTTPRYRVLVAGAGEMGEECQKGTDFQLQISHGM